MFVGMLQKSTSFFTNCRFNRKEEFCKLPSKNKVAYKRHLVEKRHVYIFGAYQQFFWPYLLCQGFRQTPEILRRPQNLKNIIGCFFQILWSSKDI